MAFVTDIVVRVPAPMAPAAFVHIYVPIKKIFKQQHPHRNRGDDQKSILHCFVGSFSAVLLCQKTLSPPPAGALQLPYQFPDMARQRALNGGFSIFVGTRRHTHV